MSFKSFLKEILGISRSSTTVNRNQQQSTEINRNQHLSTEINRNQQKEFGYNKRDLQYARRIGQIEQMAADIETIKEKLTGLDVKFDLRVPDKVLTEKRFDEEISATEDILKEINLIKDYVMKLKEISSNQQQSTEINRNQHLSTEINRNQQKELLKMIQKSAENIETSMNEIEILKNLDSNKLSTEEISRIINLSRSRTNQILLDMERKNLIIRIKFGKKFLWAKTIPK